MTNKIFNKVFSTGSNIAVLRALKNYAVGISGRETARLSKLSPKSCINALSFLENLGLVNRIRGGRDHLFSLNRNHYLVIEAILPLLDVELKYFESIKNEIKLKLNKKCISVYIFGSVARNEDNIKSDFDICVIMEKRNQQKLLENEINELKIYASGKYGITISPFYITLKEFVKRAKSNKSPVPDIIKEGILLSGKRIEKIING
ncbi:MAG TPA: nucleotidyltransferase domain-containing protein [Ignavibacteria bacterium]